MKLDYKNLRWASKNNHIIRYDINQILDKSNVKNDVLDLSALSNNLKSIEKYDCNGLPKNYFSINENGTISVAFIKKSIYLEIWNSNINNNNKLISKQDLFINKYIFIKITKLIK